MRSAEDFLLVMFFVWLLCGVVASSVGPSRYSGRLFLLTFLFMGPLGIAVALVMQAIQDFAPGPGSAAPQPADLTPIKLAPTKPKSVASTTTKPAPSPQEQQKRTIQCPHCDANLKVSADAVRFKCFKCQEISKMPD